LKGDGTLSKAVFPFQSERNPKKVKMAAFAFAPWILHAALIKKSAILGASPWNEDLDGFPSEDCAFWYPIVHHSKVVFSDKADAIYRKLDSGRDSRIRDPQVAFTACLQNVESNRKWLENHTQTRPTPEQAATVVRLIENMIKTHVSSKVPNMDSLHHEMLQALRFWLRRTRLLDPSMAYRRLKYFLINGLPY
jgi:hypothetical protein